MRPRREIKGTNRKRGVQTDTEKEGLRKKKKGQSQKDRGMPEKSGGPRNRGGQGTERKKGK